MTDRTQQLRRIVDGVAQIQKEADELLIELEGLLYGEASPPALDGTAAGPDDDPSMCREDNTE